MIVVEGPAQSPSFWAIVLAGGRGARLGGRDKASLIVGGRPLIEVSLDALEGSKATVVVGTGAKLVRDVLTAIEEPPYGGPAAGVVAGLAALIDHDTAHNATPEATLILAVDQPGVQRATISRLVHAVTDRQLPDAAVGATIIDSGRRQYGMSCVRTDALRTAVAARRSWRGAALRQLIDPLIDTEIVAHGHESRDIDTFEDLRFWSERSGDSPRQ